MTFLHAPLLVGLLLTAVPVVLHFLMRQKPKRLPFPAFRFLRQKQATNRRRVRLQHLLLLLLRVLVIACLCLALARPRVLGHLGVDPSRPVALVLLFDTSPSMEYRVGGVTRLDEAKARARELLAETNRGSEVAVVDAGDDAGEFTGPAQALARLDGLAVRPASGAVNRGLDRAYRLARDVQQREDPPPAFLYVFSDRTRASWDASLAARSAPAPAGLNVTFVDVGVDAPADLALTRVEVDPPVVAPGAPFEVRVTARGTGGARLQNTVLLAVEGEGGTTKFEAPIDLPPGAASTVVTFEVPAAPPVDDGATADVPCQVTARLHTGDNLAFNDTRRATFLVRAGRRLLTITDPDRKSFRWQDAVVANGFRGDVKSPAEAEALTANDLARYRVLALYQLRGVSDALLKKLTEHVRGGGGLAIVPPDDDRIGDFNGRAANLLPAPLAKVVTPPAEVTWEPFRADHPVSAYLGRWTRPADAVVRRYWETGKLEGVAVGRYSDRGLALAERAVGLGRVVLFTTPLDTPPLDPKRPTVGWHDYWQSPFGVVLVDRVCRHLAGDADAPRLNYACGRLPQVALPTPLRPPYAVQGPQLAPAEAALAVPSAPPGGTAVLQGVPQAAQPGNYQVLDGAGKRVAGFSLDVRPEEGDLDRVPAAEIESALGGKVLRVPRGESLAGAAEAEHPPPVELLPALMLALFVFLCVEGLLSALFQRPAAGPPVAAAPAAARTEVPT